MPIVDKTPQIGDTQEFTLETKSGRWIQAAIQHVGPGIYSPFLAREPKATKANVRCFYDTLPIRGAAGLDGQLSELMGRAKSRFTNEGADPITTIYLLDGPSLLSKAAIVKIVGDEVRVVPLEEAQQARQINLKVSVHPSGRHTLMKKDEGDARWRDCRGQLFGNKSAGAFYRAVAQYLHELQHQGHNVTYQDTSVEVGLVGEAAESAGPVWNALLDYVLENQNEDPLALLRLWREGSFDEIRKEWPDVPEAIFPKAN